MIRHNILLTFVTAAVTGYILILLARQLRVSSIVVLLFGGIIAGPELLGIVNPDYLGDGLNTIISLAVGLILFEGGLTLDVKGYRQVSSEILGVLSRGVIATWLLSSVAIKIVFGFDWVLCFLAGSLIIVTGPTVIGPLLQRIKVKKHIHNILYWEGVLIDPIGVFIALLCYEWVLSAVTQEEAYLNFLIRFLVGILVGLLSGGLIYKILERNWIPEERLNIFVLVSAMFTFALSDSLISESGLLSVTVSGFWLGYKETPLLDRIIEYKDELKDFLIGLLFILLAANLTLSKFFLYGWQLVLVVFVVMFAVRPANIFISTFKSSLLLKEKLFLSWIAPRGIVAASMSSLFAFHLLREGYVDAGFLEAFTYAVIAGTVIFQGFTAGVVGKMLGVLEPSPRGWVIIGAHKVARAVAGFIRERGDSVVLVDTNPREVKLCGRQNLTAICENAMTMNPSQHVELYGIGNIMAITVNDDLNQLICQRWQKLFNRARFFYWGFEDFKGSEKSSYRLAGERIWADLDLKDVLAQNIEYDELITCTSTGTIGSFTQNRNVLMSQFKERLFPYVPSQEEGEIAVLELKPVVNPIAHNTRREWMILSSDSSIESLYDRMLDALENDIPSLDRDGLFKELLGREREYTSVIGHGVSLPHTYANSINESVFALARVSPPVRCPHTNAEISLVFMVLSPKGHPEEHLTLISRIAKFIMKKDSIDHLMKAENAHELYNLIKKG